MQSSTHIVLASIKRTSAEMGTFQRKLFKIDDHLGIGVSGLISDGRNLCRFMRNECLSHRCCSSFISDYIASSEVNV